MKKIVVSLPALFLLTSVHVWSAQAAQVLDPLTEAEDHRDVGAAALQAASVSSTPHLRGLAARAYGRIQNAAALPTLYSMLKDTDSRVREQAAFALGQFGWKATFADGHEKEIMQQLTPLLADPNIAVRSRAVEAMGKVGLLETPAAVLPALSDPLPRVRASALMALYRFHLVMNLRSPGVTIDALPADVMAMMLKLESDPSVLVRRNLAYYFARVKDARGLDAMIRFGSADSEFYVRYFAVSALGKIGDAKAIPTAVQATADPDYLMRVAAVNALVALKATLQVPPSLEHDPSFHVRSAVAQAYSHDALDIHSATLQALLADASPTVRGDALRSLSARMKDAAETEIVKGLADSSWPIRVAAVDSASDLSNDQEAILQKAAMDPDVRVRDEALSSLGSISTPTAFAALQKALASDQLSERSSATDALDGRAEKQVPALFYSTYQNSLKDLKWVDLRQDIADLISKIPGDETTGYLKILATDPDFTVVQKAEAALKARGVTDLPSLPVKTFTDSPYRALEFVRPPVVVLETTKGRVEIECFTNDARIHVANFVGFARSGGYDGLPWHRVVSDFVVQGGDPDGTGWGDAGWKLRAEVNTRAFGRGAVGMPRSDDFDTGGVQLFINHVPTPHLDGQYTVFGQVISGMDAVDQIEVGDLILHAYVR